MRMHFLLLLWASLAVAALGCKDEARLTVLFTGDEHDMLSPVG